MMLGHRDAERLREVADGDAGLDRDRDRSAAPASCVRGSRGGPSCRPRACRPSWRGRAAWLSMTTAAPAAARPAAAARAERTIRSVASVSHSRHQCRGARAPDRPGRAAAAPARSPRCAAARSKQASRRQVYAPRPGARAMPVRRARRPRATKRTSSRCGARRPQPAQRLTGSVLTPLPIRLLLAPECRPESPPAAPSPAAARPRRGRPRLRPPRSPSRRARASRPHRRSPRSPPRRPRAPAATGRRSPRRAARSTRLELRLVLGDDRLLVVRDVLERERLVRRDAAEARAGQRGVRAALAVREDRRAAAGEVLLVAAAAERDVGLRLRELGVGLDVDLPAGETRGEAGVHAFLADRERELVVGDDDRRLLRRRRRGRPRARGRATAPSRRSAPARCSTG